MLRAFFFPPFIICTLNFVIKPFLIILRQITFVFSSGWASFMQVGKGKKRNKIIFFRWREWDRDSTTTEQSANMETRTTAVKTVSVEKRIQILNANKESANEIWWWWYLIFFSYILLKDKLVCDEVHCASALLSLGFWKISIFHNFRWESSHKHLISFTFLSLHIIKQAAWENSRSWLFAVKKQKTHSAKSCVK